MIKNPVLYVREKKQFWISADKKYQIEISEYLNNGMHTKRYVLMVSGERGYFSDNCYF
jgi:predicted restriction endonuclease